MATSTSISKTLIPFSKTQEASLRLPHRKFPRPNTRTHMPIKLAARDNSSASLVNYKPKLEEQLKRLPEAWRQIQGESDWAGLLEPMDPLLRAELIRYGEMAQACYDAFDFDPFSKYCGSCRFTPRAFFPSLHMSHIGYHVTRYLYATANINLPNFFNHSRWSKMWSKHANWAGYVAVSDDATSRRLGRRAITIAWRGTVTRLEWVADLKDFLKPISSNGVPCPDETVKVESGFLDLYTDREENCGYCKYSAREQVLTEVKRLLEMYSNEEVSITITGHSLGSALAILSAYDIVETGVNVMGDSRGVLVSVVSFSGPRVGNMRFRERLEVGLGVKVLRVVNLHDVVPKAPGVVFNEQLPAALMKVAEGLPWSYSHVGVELALDHKKSPFLNPNADAVCAHNLEALLHLLDGYHGKGERFVLASGRDPALVNKGCDFLKDHYMIPPNWRQDENKGMIRSNDGRWMQPERPKLDDHPEDMHHHLRQLGLASSDI
ncbi:phospholipase A1-Igamma1, chloroplastic [Cajanus cajan]|uniref:Lipase ZK262.3 family n=1 Tax=Cajanus cajan TaxID=3821 RepID=A0A151S380_CAJCA|nr:phospholipase A1-Igamma1, chloroplastic [Cajanus cajan]KYP49214.1 Lipase ZK262.3 family [Cajanus cajan]